MSVAEFVVAPDGRVDASLTFASAEPLGGTALRDEDLARFVLEGVEVAADGAPCEARYRGASVTEADGLLLEASYACPGDASAVDVTLYYLTKLRPGHREVARIVAPGATAEAVLTGDRRGLSLRLPERPASHDRLARKLVALTAVFTAFMLGLFVWRYRATRGLPRGPRPR